MLRMQSYNDIVQSDNVQSDNVQSDNVQSDNVQSDNILADRAHTNTEQILRSGVKLAWDLQLERVT